MSTERYSKEESKAQLELLKQSLDIVEVVSKYIELKKSGANYKACCPFHGEKSPSFTVSPAKQIYRCFGCGLGGSVIDAVMEFEKCNLAAAINKLKDISGIDRYTVSEETQLKIKQSKEEQDNPKFSHYQIGLFANNALSAVSPYKPYIVDFDDASCYLQLKDPFIKLFEANTLDGSLNKKIEYIFDRLVGYDEFYKCPSIIIRDATGKVIDMAAYRPNKPANFSDWNNPKYVLKNKPQFRGNDFLYPFQQEMERMMTINKIFAVGEGLKNGLNGYLHGLPFISLESSSSATSQELIDYILSLLEQGFKILSLFDGDGGHEDPNKWDKGKLGFENFKLQSGLHDLENALDFNSGIDFTDYIVGANHE